MPEDFPGPGRPGAGHPDGCCYVTRDEGVADSYAEHYGEGVLEVKVDGDYLDANLKGLERDHWGSAGGSEIPIPNNMLDGVNENTVERVLHE